MSKEFQKEQVQTILKNRVTDDDGIRKLCRQAILRILVGIRKIEGRKLEEVKERSGLSLSTLMKLEANSVLVTSSALERYSRGVDVPYSIVVRFLEKLERDYRKTGIEPIDTINRDKLLGFLKLMSESEIE